MLQTRSLFALLLLALACLPLHAADRAGIDALLERTGFDKLLEHIPDFARNVLKQSSGALDPEVNAALADAFQRAFATRAVKRDVIRAIEAHYDPKLAQAYLAQLDTPLARKMAELEKRPGQADQRQTFIEFLGALREKPASPKREALVERLDRANRATDFSVDLQVALFKAVFTAVDPIMEPEMRLGEGEMEKMLKEVRQSLEEEIRQRTRASYLFAFRDVSDEELEHYVELAESEPNRWAIQLLGNALLSALNQGGERAALLMEEAAR